MERPTFRAATLRLQTAPTTCSPLCSTLEPSLLPTNGAITLCDVTQRLWWRWKLMRPMTVLVTSPLAVAWAKELALTTEATRRRRSCSLCINSAADLRKTAAYSRLDFSFLQGQGCSWCTRSPTDTSQTTVFSCVYIRRWENVYYIVLDRQPNVSHKVVEDSKISNRWRQCTVAGNYDLLLTVL